MHVFWSEMVTKSLSFKSSLKAYILWSTDNVSKIHKKRHILVGSWSFRTFKKKKPTKMSLKDF